MGIGYFAQAYHLWPHYVFFNNIFHPCSLKLISDDTIFFSYNKSASAALLASETISGTTLDKTVALSARSLFDYLQKPLFILMSKLHADVDVGT